MKTILLLLAAGTAYVLLRGWPEAWHVILRVSVAGSLLLLAFIAWGRPPASPTSRQETGRGPRPLEIALTGLAILLCECALLVFFALAPSKSEELAEVVHEFVEVGRGAGGNSGASSEGEPVLSESGSGSGNLGTSNWLFNGPVPRPLNKNQAVRPSNRPEVYLYPKTPKDTQALLDNPRFLRNFTLASYRNGTWFPDPMVPTTLEGETNRITRHPTTPGDPVSYEIFHQANSGLPTLAIAIPNFTSLAQPNLRETAPDTFRLPPSTIRDQAYRYEATSIPFDFSKVTTVIPGITPDPRYLNLPADPAFRQRLLKLASSFGPPSRETLVKLQKHLQSQYQYTLTPAIPEESEPLENFLFESKSGYCSHFASATVMLTRAMGIPSRLGFGWSGGRYFEAANFFVFRAREAHTWAEIYLEGLGWVIFETTPSSREEGAASVASPDEPPPFPEDLPDDLKTGIEMASPLAPLLKSSLWTAGIAGLALLAGVFWKRRTPALHPDFARHTALPRSPDYLTAFRRTCQRLGTPMPAGRTLRDHLARIEAPDFTRDLLDYHYGVHYGERPRDKSRERKFLDQLGRWEKSEL